MYKRQPEVHGGILTGATLLGTFIPSTVVNGTYTVDVEEFDRPAGLGTANVTIAVAGTDPNRTITVTAVNSTNHLWSAGDFRVTYARLGDTTSTNRNTSALAFTTVVQPESLALEDIDFGVAGDMIALRGVDSTGATREIDLSLIHI